VVGPEHFSDAGVIRIAPGLALVQTVDFFPPLVDDAYLYGRIAAANSLSDVYAMGGTPVSALNIVGFPDKELPLEVLSDILRGGADACAEAGAVVLGGHSVRDAEVKFGLAVTGRVDPDRVVTNEAARPGDVLILTKPIGTGTATTAAKRGLIGEADLAAACGSMARLNKTASETMVQFGVRAATDITGYGLLGHAHGLAAASGVTLEIAAAAVPMLPGVMELGRQGCFTRAVGSNSAYLADKVGFAEGVDETMRKMLFEAQTSGGLLICAPADRSAELLSALHARGVPEAAVIGRVAERRPGGPAIAVGV
jgi:selenide,water dikinase